MTLDWMGLLRRELSQAVFFDEGIEAARNACVAGASLSAALITAAAYYDNPLTGAPALSGCMERLASVGADPRAWRSALLPSETSEHGNERVVPGFGFVSAEVAEAVAASCRRLCAAGAAGRRCASFLEHRAWLSAELGALNGAGLCALVFLDREIGIEDAERRFLLLRAELAMIEAGRARRATVLGFPFHSESYVYEGRRPAPRPPDTAALLSALGLDRDE